MVLETEFLTFEAQWADALDGCSRRTTPCNGRESGYASRCRPPSGFSSADPEEPASFDYRMLAAPPKHLIELLAESPRPLSL